MFVLQNPSETLDWAQDWTDWMQPEDSLASSEWTIYPAATLDNDLMASTGDLTSVTVSGLTLGVTYELKNTVTTQFGRIGSRDIIIRCAES